MVKVQQVRQVDKTDIIPHARNSNKGSERGSIQVEESLKSFGGGRSIVTDKNNVIIGGNNTYQAAAELGLKFLEIETNGDTIVVVKRKDLDLSDTKDKRAVELAYADNKSRDVSAGQYDFDILEAEMREGADFSKFAREDELKAELEKEEKPQKKTGDQTLLKLMLTADQAAEFHTLVAELLNRWMLAETPVVILEALRRASRRDPVVTK